MDGTLGEIRMFAGNYAPLNWAFCEGQLLPITSNSALFSIVGTYYGGDGRTTFGLPDFRGRVNVGPGRGPGLTNYNLADKGGVETETIGMDNLPSRMNATLIATTDLANSDSPEGAYLAESGYHPRGQEYFDVQTYKSSPTQTVNMAPDMISITGGLDNPVNVRQPYLSCYYIICITGNYPSRS